MASSMILAGLGLAVVGFSGRYMARNMPAAAKKMEEAIKTMPSRALDSSTWANSKYYRGGFDAKMNKREAALILGVSPNAQPKKIK